MRWIREITGVEKYLKTMKTQNKLALSFFLFKKIPNLYPNYKGKKEIKSKQDKCKHRRKFKKKNTQHKC